MSKRLNEYSRPQLELLQTVLSLAYESITKEDPDYLPVGILTWSADVREAIHDQEVEADSLPFNRS